MIKSAILALVCAVLISDNGADAILSRRRRRSGGPPPPPPPPITIAGNLECGDELEDHTTGAEDSADFGGVVDGGSDPDAWWAFTAPVDGFYYFATCGSSADTRLAAIERNGCNNPDYTRVLGRWFVDGRVDGETGGCDDDRQSAFHLYEGDEIWVVVETDNSFSGIGGNDYNLRVTCISSDGGDCGKKATKFSSSAKQALVLCDRNEGLLGPVGKGKKGNKGGKDDVKEANAALSLSSSSTTGSATTTTTIVAGVAAGAVIVIGAVMVALKRRSASAVADLEVAEVADPAEGSPAKQTEI
eukprot:m.406006 g.406006  ORF g.406006 m.406006 type:complete len:301 (+) comp16795_c4_seq1:1096-1998(+)